MSSSWTVTFPSKCLDMVIKLQSIFLWQSNILPSVFINRLEQNEIAVWHLSMTGFLHKYSSRSLWLSLKQQQKIHMALLLNHQWLLKGIVTCWNIVYWMFLWFAITLVDFKANNIQIYAFSAVFLIYCCSLRKDLEYAKRNSLCETNSFLFLWKRVYW